MRTYIDIARLRRECCLASVLATLFLAMPQPATALVLDTCVSADNHLYVILASTQSAGGTQVTTVALGSGNACALAEAGGDGDVLSSYAATDGTPLANRRRTAVLSGFASNAVSCASFDADAANGAGILALPAPGTRTVSADPVFGTETLVALSTADAGVPAVTDISTSRTAASTCAGITSTFPSGGVGITVSSPSTGEAANQSVTLDDTAGSHVGNLPPGNAVPSGSGSQSIADGFLLAGNCTAPASCQLIVFVASPGTDLSFGAAAAGFSVDAAGLQAAAEAAQQSGVFHGTPTVTPTSTPTPIPPTSTATPLPSETSTATATASPSTTFTAPSTATPVFTPPPTATHTAAPPATITSTATASRTRTPTRTRTATRTTTPTRTRTATRTRTVTAMRTRTKTPTATRTATKTRTATATRTRTPLPTRTRTATVTKTRTPTRTATRTKTPTRTATTQPS